VKRWEKALGWIISWRLGLLAIAWSATLYLPFVREFTPQVSIFGQRTTYFSWIWGNFDGMVFMLIARSGYSAEQLPFFPLMPILIRFFSRVFLLSEVHAGLLVSAIAFLLAQPVIFRLLKLDRQEKLYGLLLGIMLLFPTSAFYSAIYADSLFLLLACATLLLARKRKFFLASLFGAFAALARLNGLALFFVVGAEYLLSIEPKLETKWNIPLFFKTLWRGLSFRSILKYKVFWLLLIPLAFLGYLAYIEKAFGDWSLFFSGVEVWHRNKLTFPLQTFWRYFKILFIHPRFTITYVVAILEAGMTGLYLLALAWSWGKIRISYWLMIFLHLLIPTMTGTLQGMPRYGLHLYPLFLIYALFLSKQPKWVRGVWFGVSFVLLVFFVTFYTRGYFVS
jgi:hypothetical protein